MIDVKKNHFKQHFPGLEDFDKIEFDFVDQKELMAHEVVARWEKDKDFYRFSLDQNDNPYSQNCLLMAEFNEGRSWWVVGYLQHIDGIDLPKWEPVMA